MRKYRTLVGAMAMLLAMGAAFAFKANRALPGNLYYYDSEFQCVRAPCSTMSWSLVPCQVGMTFVDETCTQPYGDRDWETEWGGAQ